MLSQISHSQEGYFKFKKKKKEAICVTWDKLDASNIGKQLHGKE